MRRNIIVIFMFALLLEAAMAYAEPTPEGLRQTIRDYIANEEKSKGAFEIMDERLPASQAGTSNLRRLELVRVHERVGKTGNYYYSCTDMKDAKTGDLLDLDFDIQDEGDRLSVADVRIHKDNGDPRYTYDENSNMIPVA